MSEKVNAEKTLTGLLSGAGVSINGENPWDIQVHNDRFFRRVLSETELGLGESYMDGWWDCEALDEMINRIFKSQLDQEVAPNWKTFLYVLNTKLFNRQKRSRASQVGERHYDLGNDLYRAMLDTRLNYTCAYWKNAGNLDGLSCSWRGNSPLSNSLKHVLPELANLNRTSGGPITIGGRDV